MADPKFTIGDRVIWKGPVDEVGKIISYGTEGRGWLYMVELTVKGSTLFRVPEGRLVADV